MLEDYEKSVSEATVNRRISVVLIDASYVVRDGLRVLVDEQPDFKVVGQIATVGATTSLDVKPDLIVTDINLPDFFGTDVIHALAAQLPQALLVVLSEIRSPLLVQDVLAAGAKGYLLKTALPAELFEAIRKVASGDSYVQPQLGFALAKQQGSAEGGRDANSGALTREETSVLRHLAQGYTNKEIARLRSRSLRTVESQRAQILQKLGCVSRAELVRYAHEHGITESARWEQARAS